MFLVSQKFFECHYAISYTMISITQEDNQPKLNLSELNLYINLYCLTH